MFDFLNPETASPSLQQIARSFRTLGWVGLALQALLGFVPILVVVTSVLFSPTQRGGLTVGLGLAIVCLVLLLFSIYWCFRYTQLANQLGDRDLRPAKADVSRNLKLGLVINLGTIAIAVVIAMVRVGGLTFKLLTLPQGSTVIAPNQVGTVVSQGTTITPSNMIAIQAMVNTIAAGLVGTVIALLLLYQVGLHRNRHD